MSLTYLNNKEKLIQKCKEYGIDHAIFFKKHNRHSLAQMKSQALILNKKMYGIPNVDSINIPRMNHLVYQGLM